MHSKPSYFPKDLGETDEEDDVFPTPTRPFLHPDERQIRQNYGLSAQDEVENSESNGRRTGYRQQEPSLILDIFTEKSSSKDSNYAGKPEVTAEVLEALEVWKSIDNIDRFLEQLYQYYFGNGFSVILIQRVSNLLIMGFVVGFAMILLYCVDWPRLAKPATAQDHPRISDILQFSKIFQYFNFVFAIFLTNFVECHFSCIFARLCFYSSGSGKHTG